MAKKDDNTSFIMLIVVAAGAYIYFLSDWYKKHDASEFTNIDGAKMDVIQAERQFDLLISSGLINKNANALGLTAYEKDVLYRDLKPGLFFKNARQDAEADKIWAKYPGLKV